MLGRKYVPSKIRRIGDVAYIELSGGREAIIDSADIDRVAGRKWYSSRSGKKGNYRMYAASWIGNGKDIRMPRVIFGTTIEVLIDHINGNTLDNRRSNLRKCTNSENCQNRRKTIRKCSSVYKGVVWHTRVKKWYAQIRFPNTNSQTSLGYFDLERDAAEAYNKAAKISFGSFAVLNKV